MSTTAELLQQYAALADLWGSPEWGKSAKRRMVSRSGFLATEWWAPLAGEWAMDHNITKHEALCLWEHHVAAWFIIERGGYRVEAVDPVSDLNRRWTVTVPLTTVWTEFYGATLAEAQLAAGRAIREKT